MCSAPIISSEISFCSLHYYMISFFFIKNASSSFPFPNISVMQVLFSSQYEVFAVSSTNNFKFVLKQNSSRYMFLALTAFQKSKFKFYVGNMASLPKCTKYIKNKTQHLPINHLVILNFSWCLPAPCY